MQGLALVIWEFLLWHRFSLTYDYAIYHQALWLIDHGQLDPHSTVLGLPFWKNNFELAMWPIALIGLAFPNGPTLLVVQVLCLLAAELIAWNWICEVVDARNSGLRAVWVGATGLTLLLCDPWIYWSVSFDFHMEIIALPAAIALLYDVSHGRRRAWLWVPVLLASGNAEATWLIGIGLSALVAWSRRRTGGALIVVGVAWIGLSSALHGTSDLGTYSYLAPSGVVPGSALALGAAVIRHPSRILTALWAHRSDVWANISPAGPIGLLAPWAFGLALLVLLANELSANFAAPLFQSVPVYVLLPLGSVMVLTRRAISGRWTQLLLAAALTVNSFAWAGLWAADSVTTWLRVPPGAAHVLAQARQGIPAGAEVVASQGVSGRFSGRRDIELIEAPQQVVPVRRVSWWVVSPSVGIERDPEMAQVMLLRKLAGPLHARLVIHGDGVWVFRLSVPPNVRTVTLPHQGPVRAWALPGSSGKSMVDGPPAVWHLAGNGRAGYVLAGDQWLVGRGRYAATVRLDSTSPVAVELWDPTNGRLLVRRTLVPSLVVRPITLEVTVPKLVEQSPFQGWGPYSARFAAPVAATHLEVRVWSAGNGVVDVQSVAIRRLGPERP